ncbi:MAG: fucose-binding lectin II [Reinekea sp.]
MSEFSGQEGYTIEIPGGVVVSWSIVSQSAGAQSLKVLDPTNDTIVDTAVKSRDLSNTSSGSFFVSGSNSEIYNYVVVMSSDHTVKVDEAVINAGTQVITKTYLFAGEDGSDNDYNDAFVTLTWYSKSG